MTFLNSQALFFFKKRPTGACGHCLGDERATKHLKPQKFCSVTLNRSKHLLRNNFNIKSSAQKHLKYQNICSETQKIHRFLLRNTSSINNSENHRIEFWIDDVRRQPRCVDNERSSTHVRRRRSLSTSVSRRRTFVVHERSSLTNVWCQCTSSIYWR